MGNFPSHDQLTYDPRAGDAASETEHRGSLRLLTRPRTRQDVIRKLTRGRVLVLGLDGAGKSTLVSHLTRQADGDPTALPRENGLPDDLELRQLPAFLSPDPTLTLQSANWRLEGGERYVQLLDVSGRRANRGKWFSSTLETPAASSSGSSNAQMMLPVLGVVFVVDATDSVRFPAVATELVRFQRLQTQHNSLRHARFFLLLNKADRFLPAAPSLAESPEQDELKAKAQQHQLQVDKQRQRAALRDVRRELRRCVDYELLLDQRRHPAHYRAVTNSMNVSAAPSATRTAVMFASGGPAPAAGEVGSKGVTPLAGAARPTSSALLGTTMDCCALDRGSVRAVRLWLHEELSKTQ